MPRAQHPTEPPRHARHKASPTQKCAGSHEAPARAVMASRAQPNSSLPKEAVSSLPPRRGRPRPPRPPAAAHLAAGGALRHESGVRLADAAVLPAAQVLVAHLDAHLGEGTAPLRAGSAPRGPASHRVSPTPARPSGKGLTRGMKAGNRGRIWVFRTGDGAQRAGRARGERGRGGGEGRGEAHQPPCWS